MRDAEKDLEICNKATEGPWEIETDVKTEICFGYVYCNDETGSAVANCNVNGFRRDFNTLNNALFIATARVALSYWINEATAQKERADKVEARVRRLEELAKEIVDAELDSRSSDCYDAILRMNEYLRSERQVKTNVRQP